METFGKHLLRFAHAIDIVPKNNLDDIKKMVLDYLKTQLQVEFCEFLTPIRIDTHQGLSSIWHEGGEKWVKSIRDNQGKYNGQISYAWDKEKNVWIVDVDGKTLDESTEYKDLLSSTIPADIPKYVDLNGQSIKTSIMWIVQHGGEKIGIINFESTQYLRSTPLLKEEFRVIVESLGLLYGLSKTHSIQCEMTRKAIDTLKSYNNLRLPFIPRIFLASSNEADQDVMGAIQNVLDEYDIDSRYWKADRRPGNIQEHIWDNISSSQIGICYLSELLDDSKDTYQDNYNVIYEAGMIQALIRSSNNTMKNCVLIREKKSPNPPFNFASERMLEVHRNSAGEINLNLFSTELKKILQEIGVSRRIR